MCTYHWAFALLHQGLPGLQEHCASMMHSKLAEVEYYDDAGHVCTLESFQNTFWKPFIVTEEERQEACTLTFEHEQPAASGGDSLSGF